MHVVFLHAHGVGSVHTACLTWIIPVRRQPDFEDRKRARQKLPSLMVENGNAYTTCVYLSPTPGFFAPFYYLQCLCPYGQRCSNTNDGLFEPGKDIRFSSSVKHLHNIHLSRRLHRSTSDVLLMVAQKRAL